MESFKLLYYETCLTLKITECEKLLLRINDNLSLTILNLSGCHFADETCLALGYAIAKDVFLKELNLSNCLLSEDGLMNILLGIEKNKFLTTLNLKGNNIRCLSTEYVAKLLRHNNHLQNLYLEWNGTGIFPDKFIFICEGLSVNNSLKFLDLRENQLTDICAQALADAISQNSALQKLDLRWNNIGLTGGRAILKALSKNQNILSLDLTGNNVPRDILNAIDISIRASAERYLLNREQLERTKSLTAKLQSVEEEKISQLRSLMEVLENKEKEASTNERCNLSKIEDLKETLVEKVESINKLTSKMKELENMLSLTAKERNEFALTLKEIEVKNKELSSKYQTELAKGKKSKEEMERKLLDELGSVKEENIHLKSQVQEFKCFQSQSEGQMSILLAKVSKLETQLNVEKNSNEEQLLSLKDQQEEKLKEIISLHNRKMVKAKEELSEYQKISKQKISILENQKLELCEEVQKKDVQISSQQAQFEELMHQAEKKTKSEKDKLKLQMEERIKVLETANKKQEDVIKGHLETIYELNTKITSIDLSLAEKDHCIKQLQKCLEEKDLEKEAAVKMAKLEFEDQIKELNNLKIEMEKLNHLNDGLNQNIADIEMKHFEALAAKEEIIQKLELELEEMKNQFHVQVEEENKRFSQLQKAFDAYMIGTKQSREKDILSSDT